MASAYPEYDPENPGAGYREGSPNSTSANSAEDAAIIARDLEEADEETKEDSEEIREGHEDMEFDPYAPPSPVLNSSQGEIKFSLIWAQVEPGHRQQVGYMIPVPFSVFVSWSDDLVDLQELDARFCAEPEIEEAFRFVAHKHL